MITPHSSTTRPPPRTRCVQHMHLTRWRRVGDDMFWEDKTTITWVGGTRTCGPVLRSGSPRLVIQEAWPWLIPNPSWCAPQRSRRAGAARRRPHTRCAAWTPSRSPPMRGSFTAARLHTGLVFDGIHPGHGHLVSLDAITAAADGAARAALHVLNVPGRQRRLQARREGTARISGTPPARRRASQGNPRSPSSSPASTSSLPRRIQAAGRREVPPHRGRGPWNRAPDPPRHAGPAHARGRARSHHHENRPTNT